MYAFFIIVSLFAVSSAAGDDPCICTLEYAPVCGNDGVTYGNQCGMNCAGVQLDHVGECKKFCICPRIYRPVCGADGKTYANVCEMTCAGATFSQQGPCTTTASPAAQAKRDLCICTFIYQPVCGVDGITYGNACSMNCAKISLKKDGPCDSTTTTVPIS